MRYLHRSIPAVIIILLFSGMVFSGCDLVTGAEPQGEGFAIYLLEDDIRSQDLAILSHVETADTPVISQDDIIYYNRDTHEMALTPEAFQRVEDIKPPMPGLPFAVCVDRAAIYCGAFWSWVSSQSFDGAVIMTPVIMEKGGIIRIEFGYPVPFGGEDPRGNETVIQALQDAGKLIYSGVRPSNSSAMEEEGFAIYLDANPVVLYTEPDMKDAELADTPLISEKDIVSYRWDTHEITLSPEAFQRYTEMGPDDLPGTSFYVCLDRQPVYGGTFFSSFMSRSYDGVVIVLNPVNMDTENTIRIGNGYPRDSGKDDPRGDERIRLAFEAAGKLE